MSSRKPTLKQRLCDGNPLYGAMTRLPEPRLVEILGYAGFDFIVIADEPGWVTWPDIDRMIVAALSADTTPFVRIDQNEPERIRRALDLGAQGVVMQNCRTAADAQRFVNAATRPAAAARGSGPGRGTQWGATPDDEVTDRLDAKRVLQVLVEDAEGVRNIDDIVSVPGVDLVWVGSADLSVSYGVPGQSRHPKVLQAASTILEAGRKKGVAVGCTADGTDEVKSAVAAGYRAIICGGPESYVMKYARSFLDALKK